MLPKSELLEAVGKIVGDRDRGGVNNDISALAGSTAPPELDDNDALTTLLGLLLSLAGDNTVPMSLPSKQRLGAIVVFDKRAGGADALAV